MKFKAETIYRVRYTDTAGRTRSRLYNRYSGAKARKEKLLEHGRTDAAIEVSAAMWWPAEKSAPNPLTAIEEYEEAHKTVPPIDPDDFETWKHLITPKGTEIEELEKMIVATPHRSDAEILPEYIAEEGPPPSDWVDGAEEQSSEEAEEWDDGFRHWSIVSQATYTPRHRLFYDELWRARDAELCHTGWSDRGDLAIFAGPSKA